MLSQGPDLRMELRMRYGGVAKKNQLGQGSWERRGVSPKQCHSTGSLKITAVPEEGEETWKEAVANRNRKR